MDNFTFHNPTRIIFGKDTVGQIGGVMKAAGLRRVLLVAGGGSIKQNGVYDTVVRSLQRGRGGLGGGLGGAAQPGAGQG